MPAFTYLARAAPVGTPPVPQDEESQPIRIHQPNASDWDEITRSLRLPVQATSDLRRLVDQIIANIQDHARLSETIKLGRNRRQQQAYIRRLSRLFTQLEAVLDDRDLNTDRIIRHLWVEIVVQSLFEHFSVNPDQEVIAARLNARE